MASRRLDDLRDGTLRLCDMEDDGDFIDNTTELTRYVNEGIADLHDIRIDADDAKLFAVNGPELDDAGGASDKHAWILPSDFYRLVSVHILVSGVPYSAFSADPADWVMLDAHAPPKTSARYYLREEFGTGTTELYLFPAGIRVADISYTYVTTPPILSLDADLFSGQFDHLEYIETYAAIKCLAKEESDTTSLEFRREQLRKRITNNTKDVDFGEPRTVRMNRRRGALRSRR